MTGARPDMASLLEMLPPFAVRAAATLRLSDHMLNGARSLEDLAAAIPADADALGRLLRYLVALGLYEYDEGGCYRPTRFGRALGDSHPVQLRAWLDLDGAAG